MGVWVYLEFIRKMSLKRAFFLLTTSWLLFGCLLGIISFLGLESFNRGNDVSLEMGEDTFSYEGQQERVAGREEGDSRLVLSLQVCMPAIFIIISIVLADTMFYCMKIKRPVEKLQSGADKIMKNDLDFTIESESPDELGALCDAFEKMRAAMQDTIEMLWKEAEERKRLNAAFSHDLRNPITILKGEMAVSRIGIESGRMDGQAVLEALSEMEKNIRRIERYVEAMSVARKLEATAFLPKAVESGAFCEELAKHTRLLMGNSRIRLEYDFNIPRGKELRLDQNVFYNIWDNIILNALRFAKTGIGIKAELDHTFLHLTVRDDGPGFSDYILRKGREPFVREGDNQGEHFGMGLYICRLLSEKHGGDFKIMNDDAGAVNEIILNVRKFE